MKLQNKQTGEICPAEAREDGIYLYNETTEQWYKYELDLLASGWKYYKEPKDDEYLISCNDSSYVEPVCAGFTEGTLEKVDELGLLFKTKEEAEKAVEKLKAWKRLRDKGFRFTGFSEGKIGFKLDEEYSEFTYNGYDEGCELYINDEVQKDLDLLFGGEE